MMAVPARKFIAFDMTAHSNRTHVHARTHVMRSVLWPNSRSSPG